MTTLFEGVNDDSFSTDEATNALLARWTDASEPSDTDEGETEDESNAANVSGDEDDATILEALADEDEDEAEDDASEAEDGDEEDASDNAPEAGDDHRVKITVDGEAKTVTVKELKRLYGQEASLTRKSQEVAAARKAAETEGERYVTAAQKLLERAEARFEPFAKIDWMVAQNRLTPDEFAALRDEARLAYEDLTFLKSETDAVLGEVQRQRQAAQAEAAKEAIAVLERDIPGWNKDLYQRVISSAVDSGLDPDIAASITDPSAIKLMHDAMRFRELKAKAASKKTKAKAAPKKVVKPANRAASNLSGKTKSSEALAALAKSGSRDDAANAFLGRWAEAATD